MVQFALSASRRQYSDDCSHTLHCSRDCVCATHWYVCAQVPALKGATVGQFVWLHGLWLTECHMALASGGRLGLCVLAALLAAVVQFSGVEAGTVLPHPALAVGMCSHV